MGENGRGRAGADLVRLYLTSTKRRGFDDFDAIGTAVRTTLGATDLPLIVEGPNEPAIESEAFRRIGEAGEGEHLLLGTAEAARYRSVAAAALAYHHAVIAQSPIDVNLAKQLNILLREIGVPHEQIVIDPYGRARGTGSIQLTRPWSGSGARGPQGRRGPGHAHDLVGAGLAHDQGGPRRSTGRSPPDRGRLGGHDRPGRGRRGRRDRLRPPPRLGRAAQGRDRGDLGSA